MHANWQKEILAITPPLQFPIDENEPQVLQQPANNKLAYLLEKNVISMKRWEETWRLIGSSLL